MMSHDCWSLIHLFMAQSVTIWLPLWCPPGRASRRDWRYPGFGRTATRSTTEALNFHNRFGNNSRYLKHSIKRKGEESKDTPWYNYSKIEQLFNGWLPRKGNAPWKDWGLSKASHAQLILHGSQIHVGHPQMQTLQGHQHQQHTTRRIRRRRRVTRATTTTTRTRTTTPTTHTTATTTTTTINMLLIMATINLMITTAGWGGHAADAAHDPRDRLIDRLIDRLQY